MDYLLLYFVIKLDAFSDIFTTAAIISGILLAIAMGSSTTLNVNENTRNAALPWARKLGFFFTIFLVIATILPNTKQTVIIYCLPKMVNNEQVQKIPDKLLELTNAWIDETIRKTIKKTAATIDEEITTQ